MIAVRRPLSAAKDSGVQPHWEVPPHWEVRRIKTLFREKDERRRDGSGLLLSLTKAHGLVPQMEASHRPASSEDLSKYKLCRPGDMVMNRMQAWSGMLAVSSREGLVSPDYSVFAAIGPLECRFFEYLFKTRVVVDEFAKASKGIGSGFNRLYTPEFGAIPVAVPPLAEQVAIVRFLDHADRRIRRCIRARRKLIELLDEQKQALIQRAVTGGLDPDVRLKPSGVEWLGDLPAHWQVLRLKSLLTRIDQGVSPQAENCLADDASWGVLKAGCVNRGVFRENEHKRLPRNFPIDASIAVSIGDVLVSRASGSPHLVGSAGRVRSLGHRLILSDKIFRLLFKQEVDAEFMVVAMQGRYYRAQVEQAISGAEGLANNLPLSSLRDFRFAVPKELTEQQIVVDGLRESAGALDRGINMEERGLSLLHEFRSRLISDVVTGKLDVRDAAARLPDEGEAPEPPDEIEPGADSYEAPDDEAEDVSEEVDA